MYPAAYVDEQLAKWLASGLLKVEVIVQLAEACMGWPYVFGAVGEKCTPEVRKKYINNYKTRNPEESAQIKKTCRVENGNTTSCGGCPFYPGGTSRCFDCRGFTRWVFAQVGISIQGGGATSQWNDNSNWDQKGEIKDMPLDVVCIVFMQNGKKMSHTGIHIGGGRIIHCSRTVKEGKTTDKGWTHFAIPKGMDGKAPENKPVLRKGSRGVYVTYVQSKLVQLGYDIGKSGADGIFGAKTEEAVKKFQKDCGLSEDGVVGQATYAAIEGGQIQLYTVKIQHVSKTVAEVIIKTYGGTMIAEE